MKVNEEHNENLLESLELLSIRDFRASIERSVAQMERSETLSLEEVLEDDA
jgi:hypothetical protein